MNPILNTVSIDEAKRLCKALIGRLPRMGYEVLVKIDKVQTKEGMRKHKVYLVNESGRYRTWEWIAV